MSYLIFLFW